MSSPTVNSMSGNAAIAACHHSCSCPRMSLPTSSGATRSVTWLTNSGAQKSKTAAVSPDIIAVEYSPRIFRFCDMA